MLEYNLIDVQDLEEKEVNSFIPDNSFTRNENKSLIPAHLINLINELFPGKSDVDKIFLIKVLILGNLILYVIIFSLLLKYN